MPDEPLIRSQPGGTIAVPKRGPAPAAWCKRLRGGSVRDCKCRLPGTVGGWLECPPEARGTLSFAPSPPPPLPLFTGGVLAIAPAAETDLIKEPKTRSEVSAVVAAERAELSKIAMARTQGYSGNLCDHCGSARMKRNGACEVCEDCGTSGGCS